MAAACYLGIALWVMRAVFPSPSTLLPYAAYLHKAPGFPIFRMDQLIDNAVMVRNARLLPTAPHRLFEGYCFPAPRAVTVAPHLFGEGLFMVVPYWVTREPILSYNAVAILWLWLSALSMYALAHHWTRNAGAAFVAGLLFAFQPQRVLLPTHLDLQADLWIPLVLLFAHRLFVHGRWRDAAGLALFASLQLLESGYQVVVLAVFVIVYGCQLLMHHARRLRVLSIRLLAPVAVVTAVAMTVLGPYAHERALWPSLGDKPGFYMSREAFHFGQSAYPGTVMLVLSVVALLDRVIHVRRVRRDDPRLAFLVAALVLYWVGIAGFSIPVLRLSLPGLDMARAIGQVSRGVYLTTAFLAGWGVAVLTSGAAPLSRRLVTATAAGAALIELFHPALAKASFGTSLDVAAYSAKPSNDQLQLYRQLRDGAVLDLPYLTFGSADYAFMSAFHHHRIGACPHTTHYPIADDVAALARRLPDARAADALYGLGFRNLVLHGRWGVRTIAAELGPRVALIDENDKNALYLMQSPYAVESTFSALAAPAPATEVTEVSGPVAKLDVTFRNASDAIYRHPDRIEPTELVVEWRRPGGEVVAREHTRALLPLALAPHDEAVRSVTMPVPVGAGNDVYELSMSPRATPDLVVARRLVRVVAGLPPATQTSNAH